MPISEGWSFPVGGRTGQPTASFNTHSQQLIAKCRLLVIGAAPTENGGLAAVFPVLRRGLATVAFPLVRSSRTEPPFSLFHRGQGRKEGAPGILAVVGHELCQFSFGEALKVIVWRLVKRSILHFPPTSRARHGAIRRVKTSPQ
ncbi:hypothetical protein AKJ43_02760 [candidate division MSBL1 archaeon SCGC-AAA261D19]|uniref:Uncharacterized protein n=1 Tax=candidate division MSBL1 archaeon SCGC-AAA261D19 TaxID=1698273 RepID=A0A133V6E1_9EURY|nr:hypothetical protein AKJ43_02760 [candidate division MSBL1 archaeon SCGC-AAA261D19]